MTRFQETNTRDDQIPGADHVGHRNLVVNLRNPLNSSDMDILADARVPKARKPYMISKQREKWTEDEHKLFLEALQLHGRAWRRIQEHIGNKTAVQIRSHAQKFFSKVVRESSGDNSHSSGAAPPIQIPPPRPKRKSVHPYPCNLRKAPAKHAAALPRLEKCQQENGSPKSVFTTSEMGSEAFGSDSCGSPASTIDIEERCPTPSIATAELAVQVPPTNAKETKGNSASEEVVCDRSKAPVIKLFGKRVVMNDSHQQANPNASNLQNVSDMELDASPETPTSASGKFSSHCAAEANAWSPWNNMQQFLYYLPQGAVFFSCPSSNPEAVASHQQQHHQPSRAVDYKFMQRESSRMESNTASSSAPETTPQISESAESCRQANSSEETAVPVPGSRKYVSSTPVCQRGFMPYKRCAAESKVRQAQAHGEEADGEMTRLCL